MQQLTLNINNLKQLIMVNDNQKGHFNGYSIENTLQNKVKFFAQYYDQRILIKPNEIDNPYNIGCLLRFIYAEDYLELTPLSQITDEDAIEVAVFGSIDVSLTEISRDFAIKNGKHWAQLISENLISPGIHCLDYLRSKSYALPFMGLSIDDLISYGWVKLKEATS